MTTMQTRTYGTSGASVIVLHGGPAAVGEAAPIARGLSGSFRVLEPWQRGSGSEPLSVARHVEDLHELVRARCPGERPALVGASWGAMLALAYAAEHPLEAGPIVLIGCGTFDAAARARFLATLQERTDDDLRRRLDRLEKELDDPAERFRKRIELTEPLYLLDPIAGREAALTEPFDHRAHAETWEDMLRLQEVGVYPAAFSAIDSPVLMLHGAYDPHPGGMIRDSLQPFLPRMQYREWERCGHSPWLERHVRDEFFVVLQEWLTRRTAGGQ